MSLDFHRGYVFLEWMRAAHHGHGRHGSDLAEALGAAGDPDSVRTAEQFLERAEADGMLHRNAEATPTAQQRFFGVGGLGKLPGGRGGPAQWPGGPMKRRKGSLPRCVCGAVLRGKAKLCGPCAAEEAARKARVPDPGKPCAHCGHVGQSGDPFCFGCGRS